MSYDLVNPSIALCRKFSWQFWVKALELGTRPAPGVDFSKLGAEWQGLYLTNDGQVICAEDTYALERSLEDIPDVKGKTEWDFNLRLGDEMPAWFSLAERELVEEELQEGLLDIRGTHPLEFFAGEEKPYLVQFIRFCCLGSFEVLYGTRCNAPPRFVAP
jgi:hypothetical protein